MEFNGNAFDPSEPEILVHYEDDPYPPPMSEEYDYEDYDEFLSRHGPVFSPYSFDEILENCIIPNATDGLKMIGPVVFWCVVFRILTQCCEFEILYFSKIFQKVKSSHCIFHYFLQLLIFHHG